LVGPQPITNLTPRRRLRRPLCFHAGSWRHPGSKPLALKCPAAASGPVRNLMSSLAGSGDLLPAPIPAVNTVMLANSLGSGPTSCAPATGTISEACMTPSSTLAYDFGCLRPGHQYGLRLHLLGYAETIEDTCEIDTARATSCGIRIDNRASVKKGLLERVGRADIWLWRARTSRHRNGGACHVHQGACRDLVLLLQLVHHAITDLRCDGHAGVSSQRK
jgi:hypothetical protein